MDTTIARRPLLQRTGATRPGRPSRGRGMPARITAVSWAALLTGAGLLIGGCSAASSNGSGASAAEPKAAAGPVHGAAAGSRQSLTFSGANSSGGSGGSAAVTGARLLPVTRSIIMTASLTVRVHNARQASAAAMNYVIGVGGYTAGEQAQLSPSARQRQTVSITLKVPQTVYGKALSYLSRLGRATSLQQQSTDVTQQVADVASRVTSQQDAIAQLRSLLKRAGSVSGLLSVQRQISSDESSLEALQAEQRALNRETSYATITLLLLGPQPHAVRHHHHHTSAGGFVGGLTTGWHGLRHATRWVLTALGALLPFAAALAVIGAAGLIVWRRVARRRTPPAATPASES
ncbi:MAG TPA: DUF4349 domain-containing protein [Streptosporangiaceae bacterium]|nr:DUF4349 domain-containing protein [Streptosporangiaceae bacterium]